MIRHIRHTHQQDEHPRSGTVECNKTSRLPVKNTVYLYFSKHVFCAFYLLIALGAAILSWNKTFLYHKCIGNRLFSFFSCNILPIFNRLKKIQYWWRSTSVIDSVSLIGCYMRAKNYNCVNTTANQRSETSAELRHQHKIKFIASKLKRRFRAWERDDRAKREFLRTFILLIKLNYRIGWRFTSAKRD